MRPFHFVIRALALAALFGAIVAVASADNTDQNNNDTRYAWGENVGWLKARPASEAYGPGGVGLQVSDTDVTGYLWGENIGWVSLSCKNDNTCGGAGGNWGVKNDGAGHLSGYAWGENVGWVNFSCANDSSCAGPAGSWGVLINNYTVHAEHALAGTMSGYAWGENIGWLNFSCANDASCSAVPFGVQTGAPDSDGDGYTDAQEIGLAKDQFTFCKIMRADVNGDGKANILDMAIVGNRFLTNVPPSDARLDQNADAKINILDLSLQGSVFLQSVSGCT